MSNPKRKKNLKISERNAFVKYTSQKREVYIDTSQEFTEFLQDLPNISVKNRTSRAKKFLKPLEKATHELKSYSPSLSLQTPEEQEIALAWKEAMTNAMMCLVEELRILSSDRELSKEDLNNLLDYANKNVDYYNEAVQLGDKLDAFIK